ncbi:hypothetical protein [Natranaerobius thermophilus]|uniref:DUF4013 domain-containing protein n=1 Tax=Natranaerobius thermophilus (strain ATCC BAA-1301 / DSM 18059 / JW/NM-WN-LF) TaxID=457570 RepID=B2A798_NATTJ|nr:hypothetical protein [Natranaerobius thermophilus]ACB84292.1 hypothetical protein Nther_0700 [Natranaerobius thermophilus JW/NM-WN-LF]
MAIKQALLSFKENYKIALVPIIMDVLALLLAVVLVFGVFPEIGEIKMSQDRFHIEVGFPSIPPSVTDVLEGDWVLPGLNEVMIEDYLTDQLAVSGELISYILIMIGFTLLFLLVKVFLESGFLGCIKDGYRYQQLFSPGKFLINSKKYFWNMLKYRLIMLGILLGLLLILLIIMYGVFRSVNPFAPMNIMPLLAIIFIIFILAILLVMLFLLFAPYAIVEENLLPLEAMSVSYSTVKGNFGKTILHLLALVGIFFVVSVVINGVAIVSILLSIILYAPAGCVGIYIIYILFSQLRKEYHEKQAEVDELLKDDDSSINDSSTNLSQENIQRED